MKSLTLIALTSLLSLSSAFASDQLLRGELKSGKGPCSISIERQNDIFHTVTYRTNNIVLQAGNVSLDNDKIGSFTELYEKRGNEYSHIIAPLFIFPKLHKVTLTNLGKGAYEMKKTILRFNIPTTTTKEVCLTK